MRNISPTQGFKPQPAQPLAIRYTGSAISGHLIEKDELKNKLIQGGVYCWIEDKIIFNIDLLRKKYNLLK